MNTTLEQLEQLQQQIYALLSRYGHEEETEHLAKMAQLLREYHLLYLQSKSVAC